MQTGALLFLSFLKISLAYSHVLQEQKNQSQFSKIYSKTKRSTKNYIFRNIPLNEE